VGQFHFDPETYLELMREELPRYEELQEQTAAATRGAPVAAILELGVGTGETARRVLAQHPGATLVGVDESEEMLARAREALPAAELLVGRLQDPLPPGPFDLVVSALAVHHLDAAGKRDLFARIRDVLRPAGRFVLADVVVPEDPEDAVTPLSEGFDLPDRLDDQLEWLREAGFGPAVRWRWKDVAVVQAAIVSDFRSRG
jgi:tRNA (cmo5U34)-methyltransferase